MTRVVGITTGHDWFDLNYVLTLQPITRGRIWDRLRRQWFHSTRSWEWIEEGQLELEKNAFLEQKKGEMLGKPNDYCMLHEHKWPLTIF